MLTKGLRILICGLLTAATAVLSGEDGGLPGNPVPIGPPAPDLNAYYVLFMGNSHSAANDLPQLVAHLLKANRPDTSVKAILAPGSRFLDERLSDGVTQAALVSQPWTHVVLQAQKYSSSGNYFYPTDAAEEWIRRVKARGALPILFPEWPRRGNREEGPRVHQLHLDIAAAEPACVAPIGLAWEESIARYPGVSLHAADGNHSNLRGALLTAYVLYEQISGQPADTLPFVPQLGVDEQSQLRLREVAHSITEQQQATCVGTALGVSHDQLDFQLATGSMSARRTLELKNVGILALTIDSVSAPAASFALVGGSCLPLPINLEPAEQCSIEIEFAPAGSATTRSTLEIRSSAYAQATVVALNGSNAAVAVPTLSTAGLVMLGGLLLLVARSGAARRQESESITDSADRYS